MRQLITIKIDLERAKYLIKQAFPNLAIISSLEFNDKYVFSLSREGEPNSLRQPVYVSKENGEVSVYNPFHEDGKPIPNTFELYDGV